jgi:hypothetical protein
VSGKLHLSPTLPTADSGYPVNRWPNGSQSVGRLYIRTIKTVILSNSALRCFIVRLHEAKNGRCYGSSALNYINSASMSDSFKLCLTSIPGCSGLHFSLLAECIIILLNHSWFMRSPLIKYKFFTSFVVAVLSFTKIDNFSPPPSLSLYIYISYNNNRVHHSFLET